MGQFENSGAELAKAVSMHAYFQGIISDYLGWRRDALERSLVILREATSSSDNMLSNWKNYFVSRASESSDRILNGCRDDGAPALRDLAKLFAEQERKFFEVIGSVRLAVIPARTKYFRDKFVEEVVKLDSKWTNTLNTDKSIDAKAQSIMTEIISLFQKTINELAGNKSKLEDLSNTFGSSLASAPEPIDFQVPGALLQVISMTMNSVQLFRMSTENLVKKINDTFEEEMKILSDFVQDRVDTQKFLQDINPEGAENEFLEIQKNSMNQVSQCPTGRQQKDAEEFMKRSIAEVITPVIDFRTEYDKFKMRLDGKYLGIISDSNFNELAEPAYWDGVINNLGGIRIEGRLKEISEEYAKILPSNLSSLTDNQKQELVKRWTEPMAPLIKEIIEQSQNTLLGRLKDVVDHHVIGIKMILKR